MEYTIELVQIIGEFFEDLTQLVKQYDKTLDEVFSDVITLGSEIVEWEVTNIEKIKEK